MAKFVDGLYYSESHEYVKVEGDFAYIGISDFAQNALGNVVYVDMPEVDDEVEAGEDFGAVERSSARTRPTNSTNALMYLLSGTRETVSAHAYIHAVPENDSLSGS